jgi:hypothetical protein
MAAALGVIGPGVFTTARSVASPITDTITATIQLLGDADRVELCLSVPVDDAVSVMPAVLPSLAQSIQSGRIPSTAAGS